MNSNIIFGTPYLSVKEVAHNGKPYYFAERKGQDSIAFIANVGEGKFLLNHEFKPPLGTWLVTAFGGSIEQEMSLQEMVHKELMEEAGYKVSGDGVIFCGSYFVSTQMNQMCHLFGVIATAPYLMDCPKVPIREDGELSNMPVYISANELSHVKCWKAQVIATKMKWI